MGQYTTHTAEETRQLGHSLAKAVRRGDVICFRGGLGAGKTTFCRGLAEGLSCSDPVSSPTFAIVNYYRGVVPLAHFDAYRIESVEDLETAGLYDYLDEGAVVAVEWSERLDGMLPKTDITVNIRIVSDKEREISIEGANGI